MPENTTPAPVDPAAEKIKALQYLFDVARSASAPAAVHEQVVTYARYLADSFQTNPPSTPAVQTVAAVDPAS